MKTRLLTSCCLFLCAGQFENRGGMDVATYQEHVWRELCYFHPEMETAA
jgi:hypothetical protein